MTITEISAQKKKGRYNLFVDDAFYSGIDEEVIVLYGLKVGQQISEENLQNIVNQSEKKRAFKIIVDLISRKDYSEKDLKDKLLKKEININGINLAIEMAKEYGYLDDCTYAKNFVLQYSNKSKRELKNKLFLKGIDRNIIQSIIDEIDEDKEVENALLMAEKYMRNKQTDRKTLSSLYAFLQRKGFDNSTCISIIGKFKHDFDE